MEQVVAESLASFRLFLLLLGSFAALALLLAAGGTYAVISYIATSRTREFAIRAALGADAARVARLVIGRAFVLVATGLGLGLCVAVAATPVLENLPISIRPPGVTLVLVEALIGLVAVGACLAPARRAAAAEPMAVLRDE